MNGKSWRRQIQSQFKQKLSERLLELHILASRLHGMNNTCKIKLRASGYRLVYQVDENEVTVYVLSVGKRERGIVYGKASKRAGQRKIHWRYHWKQTLSRKLELRGRRFPSRA